MALVNEEFLDEKSIAITFFVHFVFNGMPMSIENFIGYSVICKQGNLKRYRFEVGYNKKTSMPKITWDGDVPDDIDIRVAADVMVAKLYQKLLG